MEAIRTFNTTESLEAVRGCLKTWFRDRNAPTQVYLHNPEKGAFVFGLFRQLTEANREQISRDLGYEFEECDYDEDYRTLWVYVLK